MKGDGGLYSEIDDTYIYDGAPNTNYGNDPELFMDTGDCIDVGTVCKSLIKFPDIIGPNNGQIPPGVMVQSATLELTVTNPGSVQNMHQVTEPWQELTATWNSFALPGSPGVKPMADTFTPNAGRLSLDITGIVQNWANGDLNEGIFFDPTGGNGADVDSSESTNPEKLIVVYAPAGSNNFPALDAPSVSPSSGTATTTFTYKVKYSDIDNDAPAAGDPKVHISKGGSPISGGPFSMAFDSWVGTPDDYAQGVIYTYNKQLGTPGLDYSFHFTANDAEGAGTSTTSQDAPDVTNGAGGATISFGAGGDHGWNSNTDATLAALAASGTDFFLSLGDLSYDGVGSEQPWCDYIKSWVGDTYPFQLVSGDHEDDVHMDGWIGDFIECLPDQMGSTGIYGAEYYFDYPFTDPLVRAIMITPDIMVLGEQRDYNVGDPNYLWLSNAIDDARSQGIPWVVVGMHRNCITTGIKNCAIGTDLWDLFMEKKVDVVLQGNDHNYQRSKQLSCAQPDVYNPDCVVDDGSDDLYTKGEGSILVITGNFGISLYPVDPADSEAGYFAQIDDSTYGYTQFDVSADRMDIQLINTVGSFTDAFSIVSNSSGGGGGNLTSACMGISIPAYFYPGPLWDQAIADAPATSIMIMNPSNGPGTSLNSDYVAAVSDAQAAGVMVLGYVYTLYGTRDIATVKADIDSYMNWYAVDGIFLDEVSNDVPELAFYQELDNYIKSKPGTLNMINPGTIPDEQYMNAADIIVVFEGPYSNYVGATFDPWIDNYPAYRFQHLVYDTPVASFENAWNIAKGENVGYIYITDDAAPNPWNSLPSYWNTEVGAVSGNCGPKLSLPSVTPMSGTTATMFTYQVMYNNTGNQAPAAGYPKVHIAKGAVPISGGPFTMVLDSWVGAPNNFTQGAIYRYETLLSAPGTDYSFYFTAIDTMGAEVSTSSIEAPEVIESSTNDCIPGSGGQGGFIIAQNAQLYLNGERIRIVGGNSYGIFSEYLGAGHVTDLVPNALQRFEDAKSANLKVIRFWLDIAPSDYWFGKAYDMYNNPPDHSLYFEALDRLLDDAAANGIRIVPVFASAFDQWTMEGSNTNFWIVGSQSNLLFKDFVYEIVNHYKNDPRIAWWELANEPNYYSTIWLSKATHSELVVWATDLAAFIRSIDSNHLIEGGYNNMGNLDMNKFDELNSFMDIASHHIYDVDLYTLEAGKGITDEYTAVNDYVQMFTDRAKNVLGMPILWGEYGADMNAEPMSPFHDWFLEAIYNHDSDVALVWSWEEGYTSDPHVVSLTYRPHVAQNLSYWGSVMNTVFNDISPQPEFPEPNSILGEPINLWWDEIEDIGVHKWGIPDPYFLAAIVKKESWFDASLYNAGEREAYERGDPVWYGEYYGKGLLQLTGPWIAGVPKPSTFEWNYNVPPEANWSLAPELYDAYNGTQNLDRGSWYIKALYDKYEGDKHKTASAYRWGWQPVDAFLEGGSGVDPYNNGYIVEVMNFRTEYMENVGLTEEELDEIINGGGGGVEFCAPVVENVKLNNIPGTLNVLPGTLVYVTARITDVTMGMSNISSANYTIGEANWASSMPMNAVDSSFDSPVEDVTNAPAPIDTSSLGAGVHMVCVYGSDEMGNNNTTGSCQMLVITTDSMEPMVTGFNINGAPALTVLLSSPPPNLVLQANIDDNSRGDSKIAGANFTMNGDWAGAQPMDPEDGSFDSPTESVTKTISVPSEPGAHTFCVFGWDEWFNKNTTGQCAVVTVVDDVPPVMSVADSPDPQMSGGTVGFEAVVSDNVEVNGAWIEILDPTGGSMGNFTMNYDAPSEKWKYSSSFTDLGIYTYIVRAKDTSDNWASATGSFEIIEGSDTTPPTILSVADSPDPQIVGGTVVFEAVVTDDMGVSSVWIEIFNPAGSSMGNFTMNYDAYGEKWTWSLKFADLGMYTYIVRAMDTSNNWKENSCN